MAACACAVRSTPTARKPATVVLWRRPHVVFLFCFPYRVLAHAQEELLYVPCDVLIPAAIGGVIDAKVAEKLQCKARENGLRGVGWGGAG